LSNFNTAPLRNQQANVAHSSDLTLSLASAQVHRGLEMSFTWRHNTYSDCRLRLLHHNYRWQ